MVLEAESHDPDFRGRAQSQHQHMCFFTESLMLGPADINARIPAKRAFHYRFAPATINAKLDGSVQVSNLSKPKPRYRNAVVVKTCARRDSRTICTFDAAACGHPVPPHLPSSRTTSAVLRLWAGGWLTALQGTRGAPTHTLASHGRNTSDLQTHFQIQRAASMSCKPKLQIIDATLISATFPNTFLHSS